MGLLMFRANSEGTLELNKSGTGPEENGANGEPA
jgi:hypothetical protein